jgi:hypothetical protein
MCFARSFKNTCDVLVWVQMHTHHIWDSILSVYAPSVCWGRNISNLMELSDPLFRVYLSLIGRGCAYIQYIMQHMIYNANCIHYVMCISSVCGPHTPIHPHNHTSTHTGATQRKVEILIGSKSCTLREHSQKYPTGIRSRTTPLPSKCCTSHVHAGRLSTCWNTAQTADSDIVRSLQNPQREMSLH